MLTAEHPNKLRKYWQNWCLGEQRDKGRKYSKVQEKRKTQNYFFPFSSISVYPWPKDRGLMQCLWMSGGSMMLVQASKTQEKLRDFGDLFARQPAREVLGPTAWRWPSLNTKRNTCRWIVLSINKPLEEWCDVQTCQLECCVYHRPLEGNYGKISIKCHRLDHFPVFPCQQIPCESYYGKNSLLKK